MTWTARTSDWATPLGAVYGEWIFWWVTWHIAALWTARVAKRGYASGAGYIALAIVGFVLLLAIARRGGAPLPLWTPAPAVAWAFAALGAAGVAFMWWARLTMGPLWSGGIVTREGHRVIAEGPFALVRHPIYTGLFMLAVATAAVKGDALACAGAAILIAAYAGKARLEERFLGEEFGAAYAAYKTRVPMLIPFSPF